MANRSIARSQNLKMAVASDTTISGSARWFSGDMNCHWNQGYTILSPSKNTRIKNYHVIRWQIFLKMTFSC